MSCCHSTLPWIWADSQRAMGTRVNAASCGFLFWVCCVCHVQIHLSSGYGLFGRMPLHSFKLLLGLPCIHTHSGPAYCCCPDNVQWLPRNTSDIEGMRAPVN
ncbi:hypothetical protein CVIRNUC_008433 [Coccomyxa viridis]|uniref:Secreted protein n=1 Tax=Coccomyxa viridis TaxID=1274662 RepID=A0AAV1IEY4_9CHLO|nr:hypothetical protein CVIRNUC_008433 [Coccomyxa viridis]